jgi:nitrogen fixation protein NifU and related proteins
MALEQLYQQLILEHNRNPRHLGHLPGATHCGVGQDALCGDDIRVELTVEAGQIVAAGFSGEACAVTKASASMMCDWLPGRRVEVLPLWLERLAELLTHPELPDLAELGEINQLRAVSAFPARVRNALLPWRAAVSAAAGEVDAEC